MKIIITGATGMVGKGVLHIALEDPDITKVLIISRSSCDIDHPKLIEVLHPDFFDLQPIAHEMIGYDACVFCLGVSSAGMNETEYHKLTYDLTINFAKEFHHLNSNAQFIYVSGAGTDSSENGRMMWARVKGKTENALMEMGFQKAWMFRPGFIQPKRGIRSKTKLYQFFYDVLKSFGGLLQKIPRYVTDTDKLGQAMMSVLKKGYHTPIIESLDINQIASNE